MSNRATDAVAAEIRAEMGRRNINGVELARRLEKTEMWISRRLRGVTPLTVDDVADVAAALGVPLSKLIPAPSSVGDAA